jgi:hypothetical protein
MDLLGWKYLLDVLIPARLHDDVEINKILTLQGTNLESIASWAQQDRSKFTEMNTTLMTALVRFQGIREQKVCAIDPDIRWDDVIENDRIVYMNMNANIDQDGAAGMAKMAIEDISAKVGQIYDRHDPHSGSPKQFFLLIDEIRYAVNQGLIKLLAMARGAGCSVMLAGQTLANLRAGLGGDADQAAEVTSNLNTIYQLRSGNQEDAKLFSEACGNKKIYRRSQSRSINPGLANLGNELIHLLQVGQNINATEADVPLVPPELVAKLPRGQAFCRIAGGSAVELLAFGMFPPPKANIKMEFADMSAEEADAFERARASARESLANLDDEAQRDLVRRSLELLLAEARRTADLATSVDVMVREVAATNTADRATAVFGSEVQAQVLAENAAIAAAADTEHRARLERAGIVPQPKTQPRVTTLSPGGTPPRPGHTSGGQVPTGHDQAVVRDTAQTHGLPHPPTSTLPSAPSKALGGGTMPDEPEDWSSR